MHPSHTQEWFSINFEEDIVEKVILPPDEIFN